MFEFERMRREAREQARKEEVESRAIDMIGESLLCADGIPEYRKIELQILMEVKKLNQHILKVFQEYAVPEMDDERIKEMYPARKEALEYLKLMGAGVDLFRQAHPAPTGSDKSREIWEKMIFPD